MIGVLYSCEECGIVKRQVAVTERTEAQGTVEWFEGTCIPALVADHGLTSPHCRPTKLTEVMIPIANSEDGTEAPALGVNPKEIQ